MPGRFGALAPRRGIPSYILWCCRPREPRTWRSAFGLTVPELRGQPGPPSGVLRVSVRGWGMPGVGVRGAHEVLTQRSSRKAGSWAVAWDGPRKSPALQFVLRMAPGWPAARVPTAAGGAQTRKGLCPAAALAAGSEAERLLRR